MPILLLVIIVGLIGGIAVGVQGPLASLISQRLGVMESAFIVHLSGTLIALIPLLFRGGGNLGAWQSLPWYTLLAGGFGLVVISAISYMIPRIGAAPAVVLLVAGQLLIGLILDSYGWLGVEMRSLSLTRVIGLMVVFAGVWLTVR